MSENNQQKFELTITADKIISTDSSFSLNNIAAGDNYKALNAYFMKNGEERIVRKREKSERKISNQTLPRIAFQIYEEQIEKLSLEEKENFKICQYNPNAEIIRGIFPTLEEFKTKRNTIEYLEYKRDNTNFYIYCWNIFSTLLFVQECLKRFGEKDDKFVLVYCEDDKKNKTKDVTEVMNVNDNLKDSNLVEEQLKALFENTKNTFSKKLFKSKNIIFRGAPGTGKSYLAKEIATDIISEGYLDDYSLLSEKQKEQIEFVQFHPSYDYSDFVEGIRPKFNNGAMAFERQDGIFMSFVKKARTNWENSLKTEEEIQKELSIQEKINDFLENSINKSYTTLNGTKFSISDFTENKIILYIPSNKTTQFPIRKKDVEDLLKSEQEFNKAKDVTKFFSRKFNAQEDSYLLVICKEVKKWIISENNKEKINTQKEQLKPYIFIIDEINRGEISKIFGELFFSIDPNYRGKNGEITTQYYNLQEESNKEKFYIPENVYVIGTMNDIDRSVDTFDFAMRRRFRFIEIKAEEHTDMLNKLGDIEEDARKRMLALNKAISDVTELNANYHIGAAYFLKLKDLSFDELWEDSLLPLLQDYVRGMYNEEEILEEFKKAYYLENEKKDNENSEDKGQQ